MSRLFTLLRGWRIFNPLSLLWSSFNYLAATVLLYYTACRRLGYWPFVALWLLWSFLFITISGTFTNIFFGGLIGALSIFLILTMRPSVWPRDVWYFWQGLELFPVGFLYGALAGYWHSFLPAYPAWTQLSALIWWPGIYFLHPLFVLWVLSVIDNRGVAMHHPLLFVEAAPIEPIYKRMPLWFDALKTAFKLLILQYLIYLFIAALYYSIIWHIVQLPITFPVISETLYMYLFGLLVAAWNFWYIAIVVTFYTVARYTVLGQEHAR